MKEIEIIRHSLSHVMAAAVKKLYPSVKIAIGPSIDNGFYYDFDCEDHSFSEEDFPAIEREMKKLIKSDGRFNHEVWSKEQANKFFADEPYKLELIEGIEGEEVNVYHFREFTDLCKGPHVESSKKLPRTSFKLDKTAGAYWRGDSDKKMLQRIYALAFETDEALAEYIVMRAEQEKNDHRKLNNSLDLYVLTPEVGSGLPLWTEYGSVIREELNFLAIEKERKYGMHRVSTPHITKEATYLRSGHLPYYAEDMYAPVDVDDEKYYLKPMNCPHHHYIYARKPWSYRDLPIRYTEYGTVYRYEASGGLSGLMRVRALTQDDIHIYCRHDQALEEFRKVMHMHEEYYNIFGIGKDDFYLEFALPDMDNLAKYVDDSEGWIKAMKIIEQVLDEEGLPYVKEEGEAAFYGPKVDFQVKSSTGVQYSVSTNQLDIAASPRFNLTYKDKDGQDKNIYVIHAAPLGTHERFAGFLTEHFKGLFPVWLSPVQAMIVPVADRHQEYADEVYDALFNARVYSATGGLRIEKDYTSERMQKKIRNATLRKIPYSIIVGDGEVENKTVSIRDRDGKQYNDIKIEDLTSKLKELVESRDLSIELGL